MHRSEEDEFHSYSCGRRQRQESGYTKTHHVLSITSTFSRGARLAGLAFCFVSLLRCRTSHTTHQARTEAPSSFSSIPIPITDIRYRYQYQYHPDRRRPTLTPRPPSSLLNPIKHLYYNITNEEDKNRHPRQGQDRHCQIQKPLRGFGRSPFQISTILQKPQILNHDIDQQSRSIGSSQQGKVGSGQGN